VSELKDRRTRKKAQTRELIRNVARRLFAGRGFECVTIADIAGEADVAVQTVFNHFATKEELFFDGRTPWVTGPAEAVRNRQPAVPPLTALRAHLVELVRDLVASHSTPERRCYVATLEASESLRVQERELVHAAELHLREALLEAWSAGADAPDTPADPETAAQLVAAMWMTAVRTLVVAQRPMLTEGADPEKTAADVMDLADRVFGQLEAAVAVVHGHAPALRVDTGWPRTAVLEAG
jgi:AcrR family transcriptional regulator